MKLSEIHINPDNPRLIKDDRFKKLVKSIEEFPKMMELRPIIVDADGMILGGNMRFKALQELKYKDIPDAWVKRADELTEEEKRRFIIEDNVPFGEWDWDVLANEWDSVELAEWGVEIPDFALNKAGAEEDDYEIPDEIKTDIVLGDLFEIGQHRLLCGDSTDSDSVAKLMNGQKADMVFTDPPYGMDLDTDYSKLTSKNSFASGKKHSKVIGDDKEYDPTHIFNLFGYCKEILLWGADYYRKYIPEGGSWFCWDKRIDESSDKGFGSNFELLWSKTNHKRYMLRYKWFGFFTGGEKREYLHPTQKPIRVLEQIITPYSKDNALITDLFLGSGSTMVASHQLNRKCYGMEIDPKYCQVIIDRMRKLDPDIVIKKNGILISDSVKR